MGASSSMDSSSLGMSISPPHWANMGSGWGGPGSFVGSLGAMGTSFGRDRDREMEARYVRDFSCCGKQLGGLHELLEQ
jgi:transcription factor SFP1